MKKRKCLCKTTSIRKDDKGNPIAIAFEQNSNCPVHCPELNCPEHIWKSGGINKKYVVIFCENCGKTKTETLN